MLPVEHNEIVRIDIMAYQGFTIQHRLLAKQPFTDYDEFCKFVSDYHYTSFHVKAVCDRIRDAWQSLVRPAPFSQSVRFPDEVYVHLNATALRFDEDNCTLLQ